MELMNTFFMNFPAFGPLILTSVRTSSLIKSITFFIMFQLLSGLCPDWFRNPPILLPSTYQRESSRNVNLTTSLHPEPRSKI
jgi:hypothetical protein